MKRNRFTLKKKKYSYIKFEDINVDDIKKIVDKFPVNDSGILLCPMSFDIETTSYFSPKLDKDVATMYIWQFGLARDTIIGRTWEEYKILIDLIAMSTVGKEVLIWIQNLSFEWQFKKGWFKWNINPKTGYPDVFAKTDRNVLTARYKNIEFRDSLALTSMGLASYQKNYNLEIGKLSGDLDYSKPRHSRTKLTNKELAYCINDVQVLNDWQYKYIYPMYLLLNKKIPLTSTGIVRQEIRDEFAKIPKDERKKLQCRIRNAQPTEEIYKLWRYWLFRGGLVHANAVMCNYLIEEGGESLDLKSAHPAQMLMERFPWKFNRKNVNLFEETLKEARTREYGFFGIFIFKNIRCRGWHCLESKNKIIEYSPDAVFENGRLAFASEIKVCLTEIDFFNYEDLYTWDEDGCECTLLYQARLEPLPDYVRRVVMRYFEMKETISKDTIEYGLSKRKLNSCFGMAATSLPEREVVYDPESNEMILGANYRTYDELIRWLIMLPQWAIYIAAYTRRDIVRSLVECEIDACYYDTDSNKVVNYENHKAWFDAFNQEKYEKVLTMECYDYDRKHFLKIGQFDHEYHFEPKHLKVLGAKRYLVEHDGEIRVTVAGMVKGTLERHCKMEYKDGKWKKRRKPLNIWDEFADNLTLPKEESGKQTAVYYDQEFTDTITDYFGEPMEIHEKSCVAIIDIPFSMDVKEDFLLRVEELRKERERMIYGGVL